MKYAAAFNCCAPNCAVILDTVDLHHVREERRAKIAGDTVALAQARLTRVAEMRCVYVADQVWAVTSTETSVLRTTGTPVGVVPVIHTPEPAVSGFADQRGIAFLGRYTHAPNVDVARFYMEAVHPLVSKELRDANLTLAGSDPPEEIRACAMRDARVAAPGYVPEHWSLLKKHRVGIAPLRFGAGMKGNIGESVACGLPYVSGFGARGEARFASDDVVVVGTNMAFPKTVLAEVGGFPTDFGRRGNRLLAMEEVVLRERIEATGRRSYYNPAAVVRHHVPAARLRQPYLMRRFFWQGVSSVLNCGG